MIKRIPAVLVLGACTLAACSATHPTLYPNEQYNKVGKEQAERDIESCEQQAEAYVKSGGQEGQMARDAARNVAIGGVIGAGTGAVGGAVGGDAAEGAAVGAASGATAGLLGTLFGWMFNRSEPAPAYRNFVEKCLRDKGYEPIGWD
ncbi:MAG: glycine zipper family protein [Candidatus Binatia bacterium]